jgi:circadian clock protein KaiC
MNETTITASSARSKTGVVEFDQMLRGGFMKGDAILLAGSAGTGKTTLALQYLVNGARLQGENGIYLSFEQHPQQIYRDAKNFGWDLPKMEEENKIRVICSSPNLLTGEGGDPEALLGDTIREINARRIAIDSLSHLSMYTRSEDIRMETYRAVNYFKLHGMNTILILEAPQTLEQTFSIGEEGLSFLVDCIVSLRFVEIDSKIRKAVAILKMRGSDHEKSLREYEISPAGFTIRSSFNNYQGIMSGSPSIIASEKFADMFRQATGRK